MDHSSAYARLLASGHDLPARAPAALPPPLRVEPEEARGVPAHGGLERGGVVGVERREVRGEPVDRVGRYGCAPRVCALA